MADLVELYMVDFDVIVGIDYLNSCYASIDFRYRVVKFQITNVPLIEWSSSAVPKGHFILYLKAKKFILDGCIYHFVRVNDSSTEVPPVSQFL